MKSNVFPYHHLLAFSDADSLRRMSDKDRLDLLRKISGLPHSQANWHAILELFFSWPDNSSKVQALFIADDLLEDWKVSLRNLNSSVNYIYQQGGLSMVTKIARSFTISRRETSGGKELITLANSPSSENLVQLEIDRSAISMESLNAFALSPYLRNISELTFNGITFTSDLFEILLYKVNWTRVELLHLTNCGITDARIKLICDSPIVPGLRSLSLAGNSIGDEGASILADTDDLSLIEDLDLSRNFIGDLGARRLLTQSKMVNLKRLIIRGNYIANRKDLEDLRPKGNRFVVEW